MNVLVNTSTLDTFRVVTVMVLTIVLDLQHSLPLFAVEFNSLTPLGHQGHVVTTFRRGMATGLGYVVVTEYGLPVVLVMISVSCTVVAVVTNSVA